MAFDSFPDEIRNMIEEAMKASGMSTEHIQYASLDWDCGFDEKDDTVRIMRANLLRTVFLGGLFEKVLMAAASMNATSDMNDFLADGPLTQEKWASYLHAMKHVVSGTMTLVARDAIEPFIAALDDQGKYSRNERGDFACINARLAAANEETDGA